MAALSATTTPTQVDGWLIVQNLGPSVAYADVVATGTAASGLKIEVGGVLEVRGGRAWIYTAASTADVRYV